MAASKNGNATKIMLAVLVVVLGVVLTAGVASIGGKADSAAVAIIRARVDKLEAGRLDNAAKLARIETDVIYIRQAIADLKKCRCDR